MFALGNTLLYYNTITLLHPDRRVALWLGICAIAYHLLPQIAYKLIAALSVFSPFIPTLPLSSSLKYPLHRNLLSHLLKLIESADVCNAVRSVIEHVSKSTAVSVTLTTCFEQLIQSQHLINDETIKRAVFFDNLFEGMLKNGGDKSQLIRVRAWKWGQLEVGSLHLPCRHDIVVCQ